MALSVEKSGSIRLVSHVYELYVQNFAASINSTITIEPNRSIFPERPKQHTILLDLIMQKQ